MLDHGLCNCTECQLRRRAQAVEEYKKRYLEPGFMPITPVRVVEKYPDGLLNTVRQAVDYMKDYTVLMCRIKEETNDRELWLKVKEQIPLAIRFTDELYDLLDKLDKK